MAEAKISISLSEGTFELEGSETFVAAQIERFAEVIDAGLMGVRERTSAQETGRTSSLENPSGAGTGVPSDIDEVFAETESAVQILKDIPGDSKAEKTVNAAKLYLYGLNATKHKDTALFEDVKNVCKSHGCYDQSHMAAYLKADRESFVFGGSGKKQTLKLTVPGNKAAVKLIEAMRVGSEG